MGNSSATCKCILQFGISQQGYFYLKKNSDTLLKKIYGSCGLKYVEKATFH